jgi:hypothetical protein
VVSPRRLEERVCAIRPRGSRRLCHRIAAGLVALSVAHAAVLPAAAQAITKAEYEACQAQDEASFRSAIETLTTNALQRGIAGLDYRSIVKEEWRRGGMDAILATRIDEAVNELREETSWWRLIGSLTSRDAAQQLATSVAERVFQRSEAVKKAIEGIATGVGKEVGKRIELAIVDAAEPAAQCLQAFLGPRYGSTVAGVVSRDTGKEFAIDPAKATAQISTGQVLVEGSEGLTGAVILLVRRQLSNMATRVGQRLVGAILGRIVSIVAGGVGVVLIAKDVWDLRHGVLPIVADEMKSADTRDKIQEELARSISEQISEHVRDIGAKTADRILEIWVDFRRAHTSVLALADKNEGFRKFLDTIGPESLSRLDEVVALLLASEGEPAILKRLGDGTLREAVHKLPSQALEIARETRSLETAFQWRALAGDSLPKVAEYEIYRRNGPGEFTKASLARTLSLDDRVAIGRLASLKGNVREPLLELSDNELKRLARALPEPELASLSGYLTGLERAASQRLLAAIAQSPAKMQVIASPGVRSAILQSRDQNAAISLMLQSDSLFDPLTFGSDVALVRDGRISPWLLWSRYPIVLAALGFIGFVVLMVVWRLLFGRRTRPSYY